jgi:hypothetical protein
MPPESRELRYKQIPEEISYPPDNQQFKRSPTLHALYCMYEVNSKLNYTKGKIGRILLYIHQEIQAS